MLARGLVALVALATALAIFGSLAAAGEMPDSTYGRYLGAGCSGVAESCIPTTRKDTLVISKAQGSARVALKVFFDRGHRCELEGEAQWVGSRLVVRAEGLDPEKPCELGLVFGKGVVELRDLEGRCRDVYCGTRGALDGARFKKNMK